MRDAITELLDPTPPDPDGTSHDDPDVDWEAIDRYTSTWSSRGAAERAWDELDEETRGQAIAAGVTPPVDADATDGFEPDPSLAPAQIIRLTAEVRGGIRNLYRGSIPVTAATLERLEAHVELFESVGDTAALQQAAAILDEIKHAARDARPWTRTVKAEESRLPDGGFEIRETDVTGRERVTMVSAAEVAEIDAAEAESQGDPFEDADSVTLEDAASWPADVWARFEKAHPRAAEALLRGVDAASLR
jgi:hypothetical protein